ncbi:hypothetical protein GCM10023220_18110 [Streptomyces ziwulingensis]|uniref:Uncharacterized protein n=1 Tax=Streptomyces ziwulingensis TaxID=1045501 RepID=A0ABP9BDN1_9ACTN
MWFVPMSEPKTSVSSRRWCWISAGVKGGGSGESSASSMDTSDEATSLSSASLSSASSQSMIMSIESGEPGSESGAGFGTASGADGLSTDISAGAEELKYSPSTTSAGCRRTSAAGTVGTASDSVRRARYGCSSRSAVSPSGVVTGVAADRWTSSSVRGVSAVSAGADESGTGSGSVAVRVCSAVPVGTALAPGGAVAGAGLVPLTGEEPLAGEELLAGEDFATGEVTSGGWWTTGGTAVVTSGVVVVSSRAWSWSWSWVSSSGSSVSPAPVRCRGDSSALGGVLLFPVRLAGGSVVVSVSGSVSGSGWSSLVNVSSARSLSTSW